jgi:hypothetical protein
MRHMRGKLVRCMGIVRATIALHLKAASYNLRRLVYWKECGLQAFKNEDESLTANKIGPWYFPKDNMRLDQPTRSAANSEASPADETD